ncbi:hypothetical protein L1987_13288 [Smallanthus sonchifolius]|uniref:Uncharacterized protein n=1 Tax=Smallanthus sonchifolius TaxID=185202 RepID=A0ACB9JH39_9ASTR|nr:hypothetical protein L1987_13288 [Smallanthus sonchifolius]
MLLPCLAFAFIISFQGTTTFWQLRNRDAALRSREMKKMLVKDLEMKSRLTHGSDLGFVNVVPTSNSGLSNCIVASIRSLPFRPSAFSTMDV